MPHRRLRQISLRSIFILMAIFACGAAWIAQLHTKPFILWSGCIAILVSSFLGLCVFWILQGHAETREKARIARFVGTAIIIGLCFGVVSQTTIFARLQEARNPPALQPFMLFKELAYAGIAFGGIAVLIGRAISPVTFYRARPREQVQMRLELSIAGGLIAMALLILRSSFEFPEFGTVRVTTVVGALGMAIGYLLSGNEDQGSQSLEISDHGVSGHE